MTYMELLDEYDVFFDAVVNLDSPEYDQLQKALSGRLKDEVPQQAIDALREIQKELSALDAKKYDLLKLTCETVVKMATNG